MLNISYGLTQFVSTTMSKLQLIKFAFFRTRKVVLLVQLAFILQKLINSKTFITPIKWIPRSQIILNNLFDVFKRRTKIVSTLTSRLARKEYIVENQISGVLTSGRRWQTTRKGCGEKNDVLQFACRGATRTKSQNALHLVRYEWHELKWTVNWNCTHFRHAILWRQFKKILNCLITSTIFMIILYGYYIFIEVSSCKCPIL